MIGDRRSYLYLGMLVLVGSLLGGLFGPGITGVSAAAANHHDDVSNSLKSFLKVYELVEQNFAEKVNADQAIYKGAIPGMLRTLDPHSSFYDPKEYRQFREEQQGRYYGVGMTISPRNNQTVVIAPFPGSPAYKAGIRPGDVILEISGRRADNLTTTEIADLMKGPRGTHVRVVMGREGVEKPLVFDIIRDEIPRKSVEDGFWVKPGIAFIYVQSFNENTGKEVDENLKRLGEDNIKGLILDLRENPGGLLTEGIHVAGRFLKKGQTVVAHKGRASPEKPYYASRGNGGRDYPIVVLVNRFSASAAEIVSGALQDHDRAWILGENTFGKGLVQTIMSLPENTGLVLTTSKYYTPSGRLIQRDYSQGSFLDYYYSSNRETRNPLDVKMTDSGRTVYGGGGISPDEKFIGPKLDQFQTDLTRKYMFFTFTSHWFAKHDAKLPRGWQPDEEVLNSFHDFLLENKFEFTEGDFTFHHDWLKQQVRREFYITAFNAEEARRLSVETDPFVLKAIDAMPNAKALLENVRKMIVQRTRD